MRFQASIRRDTLCICRIPLILPKKKKKKKNDVVRLLWSLGEPRNARLAADDSAAFGSMSEWWVYFGRGRPIMLSARQPWSAFCSVTYPLSARPCWWSSSGWRSPKAVAFLPRTHARRQRNLGQTSMVWFKFMSQRVEIGIEACKPRSNCCGHGRGTEATLVSGERSADRHGRATLNARRRTGSRGDPSTRS